MVLYIFIKLIFFLVMAATAGGPDEDTYGTWCNITIKPCLAGLFAHHWMKYAENVIFIIHL